MLHNHNPDATWETTLVIPEASKPIDVQTLDALLRVEALLEKLVRAKGLEDLAAVDGAELSDDGGHTMTYTLPKTTKGKRKA